MNNGVYRAGFATTQEAYEDVFSALDRDRGRAMFTTLLRFDLVYYAHFKCSIRRIQDDPNLGGFLRDIYQMPDVEKTCWLDHTTGARRLVPLGPSIDLEGKHDRARLA